MSIQTTGLSVDGTVFNVLIRYESLSLTPEAFITNSGETIGRVVEQTRAGTRLNYTLVIDPSPNYSADYNDLRSLLADSSIVHTFIFPRGSSTVSFTGAVLSGKDKFAGFKAGSPVWRGLEITVEPLKPQIV